MRTVYEKDGIVRLRNLRTGAEYHFGLLKGLFALAGIRSTQTPVGPTCDGVERWAYVTDEKAWTVGECVVYETPRPSDRDDDPPYSWSYLRADDSFAKGFAPTLPAAKKAAERAAKETNHE